MEWTNRLERYVEDVRSSENGQGEVRRAAARENVKNDPAGRTRGEAQEF